MIFLLKLNRRLKKSVELADFFYLQSPKSAPMNKTLDEIKKELTEEIKSLAEEIANVNSFNALLMQEIKLRNWYEKFTVVKYLNKKRILEADLDLATDLPLSLPQEETEENTLVLHQLNELKEEVYERDLEVPKPESEPALNPIRLDLNDKIAFKTQLFKGDDESLSLVLRTLNRINDLSSSLTYLEELKNEMGWSNHDEEYLDRLRELVAKRFH